ncbi:unnamed protein product [Nesidiocoris tenuis]|uniref:Tumour suppressor protein n=2 Tax=Nesidiocoris tenuis TaxID=355587 RepID=A0ABN7B498_9HEMI|nr:Tumour suppressor protein [Nesidiocoris tenuis]CAB0002109.1 unnamed protein product [Nesidiocoris tenuis]
MGSEQSSQAGSGQKGKSTRAGQLRRGKSVPESRGGASDTETADGSRPGSCSPGLSVCSDSDLPYISYTVNRPIGDSPKLQPKQSGHLIRGKSMGSSTPTSPSRKGLLRKANTARAANSVVVVKPAVKEAGPEKDPDIARLQKIPMFLPIMRGTLNLPAPRDPEILERLDPNALYRLCLKCEKYLNEKATQVAGDQHLLALQIKEIDTAVAKLNLEICERQKAFAKHADHLAKVNDVTNMIRKCHAMLNTSLEAVDRLNKLLPESDRLETFVWTTG